MTYVINMKMMVNRKRCEIQSLSDKIHRPQAEPRGNQDENDAGKETEFIFPEVFIEIE
jgi:hypothetical protein